MSKKTSITLLFTMVFTIFGLFAATEVMAQCISPECIEVNGWEVQVYRGADGTRPFPWTFSGNMNYDGVDLACPPGEDCVIFEYTITPAPSGTRLTRVDLIVPVCTDYPIDDIGASSNSFEYYAAGAGDPATYVGNSNGLVRVMMWPLRINPGTSTRNFWVATTQALAFASSMALRIGNVLHDDLILAPACWTPAPQIQQTTRTFTIFDAAGNPHTGEIVLDQNGNIVSVTVDGNPVEINPISNLTVCGPDPDGEESITLTFDVPYECGALTEATPWGPFASGNPGCWIPIARNFYIDICP